MLGLHRYIYYSFFLNDLPVSRVRAPILCGRNQLIGLIRCLSFRHARHFTRSDTGIMTMYEKLDNPTLATCACYLVAKCIPDNDALQHNLESHTNARSRSNVKATKVLRRTLTRRPPFLRPIECSASYVASPTNHYIRVMIRMRLALQADQRPMLYLGYQARTDEKYQRTVEKESIMRHLRFSTQQLNPDRSYLPPFQCIYGHRSR
eukprot:6212833-Pleurochrysis_carterae.AAC.2